MSTINGGLPIAVPLTPDGRTDVANARFASTVTSSADVAKNTPGAIYVGDKPPAGFTPLLLVPPPGSTKSNAPQTPPARDFDESPISDQEAKNLLLGLMMQQMAATPEGRAKLAQMREAAVEMLIAEAIEKLVDEQSSANGNSSGANGANGTPSEQFAQSAYRSAVANALKDALKKATPKNILEEKTQEHAKRIIGKELKNALADPANTTPEEVAHAASTHIIDRFEKDGLQPEDDSAPNANGSTDEAPADVAAPDDFPAGKSDDDFEPPYDATPAPPLEKLPTKEVMSA